MAISEAVEDAATRDDTKYALGSVLNHVLLHQTVIGQEAIEQMGMAGESPDVVIGCTGGGSNFAGLTFPFLGRNFRDGAKHRIIAVEPEAAPSLTRGVYAYDFGDTAKMAPVAKMHTLGHDFIPEPIHAGGLRYHGMSPLVSLLKEHGDIEARSVHQRASFEAGVQFARAEGILPAPEPTHAIRVAIDEALAAKEAGEARVILFNLCGHGHFDLSAYERYLDGSLEDYEYPLEKVEAALAALPQGLTATELMPHLACRTCGRRIYSVAPLSSMTADERRCPRCGALPRRTVARPSAGRRSGARTRPTTRGRRPATTDGEPEGTEGLTDDGTERRATDRRTGQRRGGKPPLPGGGRRCGSLAGLTIGRRTAGRGGCDTRGYAGRLPRLRSDRRFDRSRRPRQPRDAGTGRWPPGRRPGRVRGRRRTTASSTPPRQRRSRSCATRT